MNKRVFVAVTMFVALVLTMMTGSCCLNCFVLGAKAELIQTDLVTEMISKMNKTEIYNTVYALQNLTTRIYGYSGNVEAATYLYNRLSNIPGLSVEYQSNYKNIVATLLGVDTTSNATYVVGAHYDSTSSNQSYAPGATDDGGGVAIVLEFARIMSQYSFNHTLKFAFWNREEDGGLGSAEYVKYAYSNGANVSLYINFDSSCYDPDGRMILDIMSNQQSSWVSNMMTEYNTLYGINFTLTYNAHTCFSDHRSFWDYGYTAVMTHSESHGPAHSPDDTIDKISTVYAEKNGQLGMSVLATLAEVQGPTPTSTPTTPPTPTPTVTPTPTTVPTPTPALSPSQSPSPSISPTPSPEPTRTPTAILSPEAFYAVTTIGITSIIILAIVKLKKQKRFQKTITNPPSFSFTKQNRA